MRALDRQSLLQRPAPSLAVGGAMPLAVLAQAKSTLGSGPSMLSAPPIVEAGRPLDGATRGSMESGFGRDFSNIRVHDDARAHDNARALGARAYAAGDHIVFGEGQFRPESSSGRALIAHELAHSVQQGGVQMKADGPMPAAADAELEAQADSAAAAVTAGRPAPALSRIGTPAIFRNPVGSEPPAAGAATAAGPTTPAPTNVPNWVTGFVNDDNPGNLTPSYLGVRMANFAMPVEKGMGDWVQAAYNAGGLVSTVYTKDKASSYKEGLDSAGYQQKWLTKYGFTSFKKLSEAILEAGKPDNPTSEVTKILDTQVGEQKMRDFTVKLAGGIGNAKVAVDHIAEKHMGGASVGANLQLFDGPRNSASGTKSWYKVIEHIDQLRAKGMRGEKANQIQIYYDKVTVEAGPADPGYYIETILRGKLVKGSDDVKSAQEGKPVKLLSGPNSAITNLPDKGTASLEGAADRVVQGMQLATYKRSAAGPAGKTDDAEGDLDHKALKKLDAKQARIKVKATLENATAAPPTAAAGDSADAASAAVGETRRFSILPGPQKIPFEYPGMSPGYLTRVDVTDKGELTGTGVIQSSVKFLGDIDVIYGPEDFRLAKAIDIAKINNSAVMRSLRAGFRFTSGSLAIDLMKFKPEGNLGFSIGPEKKPILIGDVKATTENGSFAAKGTIKSALTIPGLSTAEGEVSYIWGRGWAGQLKVAGSPFKGATADITLGFSEVDGKISYICDGAIATQIRGADLSLKAKWAGGPVLYSGDVTVKKPFPLIDSVKLVGTYSDGAMGLTGSANIRVAGFSASMVINYDQKDGEEGKFSGIAKVDKKGMLGGKADVALTISYSTAGELTGEGIVAYQITPAFRPEMKVSLLKDGRIHVKGTLSVTNYQVFKAWPGPGKDRRTILKGGISMAIPIPPMPALQATLSVTGELGVGYSVGPGLINGSLTAEMFPFEQDMQVKAHLEGKFTVPARAELYGKFGALLGVAVAGGLLGVEGGIYLKPSIEVVGAGGVGIKGDYADGGFSFEANAFATGAMYGTLGIDFAAAVYVARNLLRYEWTHPLAKTEPKKIGPDIDVQLGKIAYARDGTITWPDLSQISVTPKEFDPLQLVRDILQDSKTTPEPEPPEMRRSSTAVYDRGPKW